MAGEAGVRWAARRSAFAPFALGLGLVLGSGALACDSNTSERPAEKDAGARDGGAKDAGSVRPDAASAAMACAPRDDVEPLLGMASAPLTGKPPLAVREDTQLLGEGLLPTHNVEQTIAPGLRWQQDRMFLLADQGFWDIADEDGARWYTTSSVLVLSVRAADIDGDGDQDLLLLTSDVNPMVSSDPSASPLLSRLAVWERTADGLHERADVMTIPYVILPIPYEVGDVDGDGDLDVVQYERGAPIGYIHDGAFGFTRTVLGETASEYEDKLLAFVFYGDRNQDGDGDMVVVTGEALDLSVFVLLADGKGRFGSPGPALMVRPPLVPHGPAAMGLWLGDVTGDGLQDVVTQDAESGLDPVLHVYASRDATSFAPRSDVAGLGFEFADVDGDGKTDLVTTREERLTALLSRGDGEFEARDLGVHMGPPVRDFAVDPDADGKPVVHILYDLSACPTCTDQCAGRCLFGACTPCPSDADCKR